MLHKCSHSDVFFYMGSCERLFHTPIQWLIFTDSIESNREADEAGISLRMNQSTYLWISMQVPAKIKWTHQDEYPAEAKQLWMRGEFTFTYICIYTDRHMSMIYMYIYICIDIY